MGSGNFQESLSLDGAVAALILSQERFLTLEPASFPQVIGHYQVLRSRSRNWRVIQPLGTSQVALVVKNLPAHAGDLRDMV